MPEFDLIKRLADAAKASDPAHADMAREILAERARRNAPFVKRHAQFAPSYEASDELKIAVNVALSLGRPLLLTGLPGCGKTLAAYWLAHVLGVGPVLEFFTKSESRARDLLYTFDAASWFRASQLSEDKALVEKDAYLKPQALGLAFGWKQPPDRPSVVLIDEIEKAPRDFPNDLLLELDQMRFVVEETGRWVACPADQRPIVIITSNAERQLPSPFLRRCVVHEIRLGDDTIASIIAARLSTTPSAEIVLAAVKFWKELGQRRPTIDEFWRWLALETGYGGLGEEALAMTLRDRNRKQLAYVGMLLPERELQAVFGQS